MASRTVDFSGAAEDYARHRPGFPDAFFDRVARLGVGARGQRVLDLGTGTGTLARGFAARGCVATGIDPSAAMLAEAKRAASREGLDVDWVEAYAETTGLADATFDVVCAGQCWHWFDRPRVAREMLRLLRPGGHALVAYFSYLAEPGSVGAATEAIVLRHHPAWTMAGEDGRHPEAIDDLRAAGFVDPIAFEEVLPIPFTHEAWRGRFRACNGVLALPRDAIAAFDAELATLLRDGYPDPLVTDHRIYAVAARRP